MTTAAMNLASVTLGAAVAIDVFDLSQTAGYNIIPVVLVYTHKCLAGCRQRFTMQTENKKSRIV